jgi:amino acid adenylation domain-containing protein
MRTLGLATQACGAGLCDACFVWEACLEDAKGIARDGHFEVLDLKTLPAAPDVFDFGLKVQLDKGSLKASIFYRKDLFETAAIERMSRHFLQLLQSIANGTETPIARLNMISDEEQALLLGPYAGSRADYPRVCVHQLFTEQVALRPDAEAIVFGTERLTYRQLDQRSNQVAQFLRGQGIGHEDRVGIFMDRSAHMIVSMLGTLKAGGAYVPIDPDYPAERLKFIAEDTGLRLVLTEHRVKVHFPTSAQLVYVDGPNSPIGASSNESVSNISTPESVAVVIYTSGSTGQPKAARIPHRAVIRTVRNTNYIQISTEDRITQVTSPSFDAAIQEIWLALANGASLVGMRRETLLDTAELLKLLRTERITVLVVNTAYVHQIGREAPEVLKGVRKVLFGGEAAEPGPLRRILKHVGPSVLVNGYGPSEGCVITTYYEITSIPEDATTVPIGRPVTNAQVYLLDDRQRAVPIGLQGEIYIGGEGVAQGYWKRPELTAQRFFPDTFSGFAGGVLYRTGDLARMRSNGELEFIGRIDEQVKIRGHRIELAEVREPIAAHPDVKQVFLMVREDHPGDKRLVAYVTLQRPLPSAPEVLRQYVKDKLPAHMLPATFVVVDSIPLNTNGKVDRKALPAPHSRPELGTLYKEPQTELERQLTQIWQELLGIDNVGVNDNFFDLGVTFVVGGASNCEDRKRDGPQRACRDAF